jgi:hypothetical protein
MAYYSFINYTGNGSLADYAIPFPYLYKTHVKVYVQGILKTVNLHYSFSSSSVIHFASAPLDGEIITIKRDSSMDTRLVDYTTGTILKDETLDLDSNQLFYLMQEAADKLAVAENADGDIFTSPESILNAIMGSVDVEHLVSSLNSPIGYWAQIHDNDAIYEFNEDGTTVYEYGVMGDGAARIELAEDRIDAVVTDADGNAAQLALMANEFYVKLDGNGNVAGFGLYNGDTSNFIVNVDKFAIIKADGTGDVQYPFIVDTGSGLVAISGNLLVGGSVSAAKIAADAIEASHIGADVIETNHIAIGAVGTTEIDTGAITAAELATNAVTGVKILNGAVIAEKIATNAVTAVKINALAVETGKLAANAVTTAKLEVGGVTGTCIEDGAIITQKLAVDAITAAKIATGAVTADAVSTNEIVANTANIKNAVITGAKMVNLTVDTLQIKGNAVTIPVNAYASSAIDIYYQTGIGTNILSATIQATGSPIQIIMHFYLSDAGSHNSVYMRCKRGDTQLSSEKFVVSGNQANPTICLSDTPSAGSHTYYLNAIMPYGNAGEAKERSILLLETKK